MNFSRTSIIGLILLGLAAFCGGCSLKSPQESSIPWNHPADWEGQMPGMNPNGGMGGH